MLFNSAKEKQDDMTATGMWDTKGKYWTKTGIHKILTSCSQEDWMNASPLIVGHSSTGTITLF